jgi:hypothetical protein
LKAEIAAHCPQKADNPTLTALIPILNQAPKGTRDAEEEAIFSAGEQAQARAKRVEGKAGYPRSGWGLMPVEGAT